MYSTSLILVTVKSVTLAPGRVLFHVCPPSGDCLKSFVNREAKYIAGSLPKLLVRIIRSLLVDRRHKTRSHICPVGGPVVRQMSSKLFIPAWLLIDARYMVSEAGVTATSERKLNSVSIRLSC